MCGTSTSTLMLSKTTIFFAAMRWRCCFARSETSAPACVEREKAPAPLELRAPPSAAAACCPFAAFWNCRICRKAKLR
eukprot:4816299-Pleurochrysis_carterae.AAC.1